MLATMMPAAERLRAGRYLLLALLVAAAVQVSIVAPAARRLAHSW
jgi:hypothetical protein